MAKGTVKRKPTPSAMRKRKAQQRIRKHLRHKHERQRPNWKQAILKTYKKGGLDGKADGAAAAATAKPSRKRGRDDSVDEQEDHERDPFEDYPDQGEVQSDVDEEKEARLNERDPLETQLFLKGLPLDTDEAELKSFFSQHFGAIRRVLLVRNRVSKAIAGTAFVHCGSKELADTIFAHAQQNAREVSAMDREAFKQKTEGMSHHKAKSLKYKLLTDTFVARDPFLTLRETRMTVHRVLTRSDTQEAVSAQEKKKKRTKVAGDDPRNLYLLQEGLILPDTPAARDLHPRYLQMIQDDYEARKQQVTNSNYFVSRTRLSVRNLPRTMTENDVRRLFADHARRYLKDHKEDMEKEKWGKYGPIRNVKVLRDNAGVSKGYGFIEFVNHNVALHALRMINNNPTLFGDHRRLMVSFAIENTNAVQKLQRIKELRKKRLSQGGGGGGGGSGGGGDSSGSGGSGGGKRARRRSG